MLACDGCGRTIKLIGAAEVRQRFGGISGPTLKYWRDELDFPTPDEDLRSGPVWDLERVFQWGVSTGRLMERRDVPLPPEKGRS